MEIEKIKSQKTIQELLEFGIINIDKSSGPTSFNVSDFVRKKLNLRKTSHFGTLDPKVTGVLPVALNRACKLTGYFLGENKEYVGIMRLHEDVELEKIKKIIKEKFTGKIKQTPPVKSRVKRVEREREIISFELIEKEEKDILFKTEVQGGTYIRKLIDDLGKEIGGAHMLDLRRTRAGIFKEDSIVNLYEFEKAVDEYEKGGSGIKSQASSSERERNEENLRRMIVPAEIISEVYPVVQIKSDNLKQILTGKPIFKEDLVKKQDFEKNSIVCVFADDKFVGMYKVINSGEIFAKAEFVMQEIKG